MDILFKKQKVLKIKCILIPILKIESVSLILILYPDMKIFSIILSENQCTVTSNDLIDV